MVRQLLVAVAGVVLVAAWAAAEPCYSCGHSGKQHRRFGVPGGLSQAGRFSHSQSQSQHSSFSQSQSHAHSHSQAHAQSQAHTQANAQSQAHAQANAQSQAHAQAHAQSQARAQSHAQSHAQSQAQSQAFNHGSSNIGSHGGLGGSHGGLGGSHGGLGSSNGGQGGRHNVGHPTGCPGCGCGACGGSCGWCGGNYGRRKRSVDGLAQSVDVQNLFDAISSEDKNQCGLRLVCELAQEDPRNLAEDEVQILLPYRGAGESDGTAYGQYDEAAWHGQEGHQCAEHYPQCAFTASQIMDEYRKEVAASPSDD